MLYELTFPLVRFYLKKQIPVAVGLSRLPGFTIYTMRRNLLLYCIAFIAVICVLFLFNKEYRGLSEYTELSTRHNLVHSSYLTLYRQLNNAAVLHPQLQEADRSELPLFYADSLSIIEQLKLLKTAVRDSVNIQMAETIDSSVRAELSWIIKSNVPDSILYHRSSKHITALKTIDSLIRVGLSRTSFLVSESKRQVKDEAGKLKLWITIFILLAGTMLLYITVSLLQQRRQRKRKEKELEAVFDRVNDAVVSVDNNWRYTFLNDAALETHPAGKEETLGKVIWDVHPEMKGTIFWDKYYEAMQTRQTVEIEDYFAPMDSWISVKVYPSVDGLTLFYKDITKNKKAEQEISKLNAELEKKVLERTDELLQAKNKLSETLEKTSFLATIADNIQDPVISTDNDAGITRWNKAAELLLEWKTEEVIGKNATEILHVDYLGVPRDTIYKLLDEKNYWQGEVIYHTKSGRPVNVLITASRLKDSDGNITGSLALVRDITERKKAEIQLKEFEHFFSNSNDFSCIANTEGHFEIVNLSFNNLLGYSQNELSERPFIDFVHPDDITSTIAAYEQLKSGAKLIHFINRYRKKDGSYLVLDWNASPNPDTGKLYCIARDITERKKAEAALSKLNEELEQKVIERTEAFRQSKEQYRYLFQNNPMPMWVIDLDNFRFLDVNEMATLQYGYSREEFLSMTAVDIRPEEDASSFIQADHSFENSNQNYNKGIWRHRKKDGSIILVDIIGHKILFEGIPARLILAHDVTQQEHAKEKLVSNEKRFRALVENSNDIIGLLNDKLVHVYRSPSSERITGYTWEERMESGVMGEIHPEDYPAFEKSLADIRTNPGKVVPVTYRLKHKNGAYIWLEGTFTNLLYDPSVGAIVVNMRDITGSRNNEQKIIRLNEELEEKVMTRTEQLRRSNEELEAFSYSVSHDLRAPLRGIIGFTNILEEDYSSKLDAEAKRITAIIKNNTVKMGTLIDDLLSFSRLGRQPVTKTKLNTNDIINEITAEPVIKNTGRDIIWIIPDLPAVHADPVTIKQVWMNLVSNAVKYSNKNPQPVIEIGTTPAKDEIIFFVKDNGVGFDEKYRNKLFKVFQRLHSASEFEGTGVGLAIVEKIITRHDGKVWAEAEPGKGACFYFSLPKQ